MNSPRVLFVFLFVPLLFACQYSRNTLVTEQDGMQLLDLGHSTIEYYGDYDFEAPPENWKDIVQMITSENRKLKREHITLATTIIEPDMNCVILDIPNEGPLNEEFVRSFFNERYISSYLSETHGQGQVYAQFWVNPKSHTPASVSVLPWYRFYSVYFYDTDQHRTCIIHWHYHKGDDPFHNEDPGGPLRRESRKIFQSLQIKPSPNPLP